MNGTFAALPLHESLISRLRELGIASPSPIQEKAIPVVLEGKDVLVQSQTGTGKTLAYLLPVLQRLERGSKHLQAIVVVPTRELGMQILHEIELFAETTGILGQALIGGASVSRQIDKLRLHPQIVVGTPGRILELIKQRKLKLHEVRTIVVDEADQVFALGAMGETEAIFKSAMRDKQLVFVSATLPQEIRAVTERWMRDPVHVDVQPGQRTAETLEHLYYVCDERDKIDTLRKMVRMYNPKSAIVFINDTDDVAGIVSKLKFAGLSIEALYGESDKQERAVTLKRFRDGKFQLLLATDVAARGLDIKGLTHVINFDQPFEADRYVHRAGRTGRMGKSGTVVTIVTPKERTFFEKLGRKLGIDLRERAMYFGKEVSPEEARRSASQRKLAEPRKPAETAAAAPKAAKQPRADEAAGAGENGSGVRPASQPPAAKPPKQPPQGTSAAKFKAQKERDRKNKGAPKWLKSKQDPQK